MKKEGKVFGLSTRAFLCVFLSLSLMFCSVPLASATDDADAGGATQEDIDNTRNALSAAIKSEVAAGEVIAAANEALAGVALESAVDTVEGAQAEIDAAALKAQEASAKAAEAQANAEEAAAKATEAQADAEEALSRATGAKTAVAEAEAALAKEAATEASVEAVLAFNALLEAYAEAEAAKLAYEQAQEAYDEACKEAQEQLNAGLISAKRAAELAAAAAEEPDRLHSEMVEKQAAAEKAAKEALAVKDQADAELRQSIEELADLVEKGEANVDSKTAATAAAAAALKVTKNAVSVAEETVGNLESNAADIESQIEKLDGAIAQASEAIEEAQKKLDALDPNSDEYSEAKLALENAQKALAEATEIQKNAQEILEKRDEAQSSAEYIDVVKAQQNIAQGMGSTNDIRTVSQYVLGNVDKYIDNPAISGEVAWVDDASAGSQNVFYFVDGDEPLKDESGNILYYEAKTVQVGDSYVVQYVEAQKTTHVVESIDELSSSNEGDIFTIDLEPKTISVDTPLGSYSVSIPTGTYTVQKDETGYYIKALGTKLYIKQTGDSFEVQGTVKVGPLSKEFSTSGVIENTSKFDYVSTGEAIMDSNAIESIWDQAEHAEENLIEATETEAAARQAYEEAIRVQQDIIDENNQVIELSEDQKAALEAQLEGLEDELDGNLIDQLLRASIEQDNEAIVEVITAPAKIFSLKVKDVLGELTDEEQSELDELTAMFEDISLDNLTTRIENIQERNEAVREVLNALEDEELNADDAEAIVRLVNSTTLSAKTKLAILQWIETLAQCNYDNSVKDLEQAVKDAEQAVEAQQKVVQEKTEAAQKAAEALEDANAQKALVDAEAALLECYKGRESQAAKDAQAAYEAFKVLVEKGLTPNDTELIKAKKAYEDAERSYEVAKEKTKETAQAAYSAIEATIDTYAQVDEAYTRNYNVTVEGGTATVSMVPIHIPAILDFAAEYASLEDISEFIEESPIAEIIASVDTGSSTDTTSSSTSYTTMSAASSVSTPMNSRVILKADSPEKGMVFDKWLCNGVEVEDATASTTIFTMPENDVTFTATYKEASLASFPSFTVPTTGDSLSLVSLAAMIGSVALAGLALMFEARRRLNDEK